MNGKAEGKEDVLYVKHKDWYQQWLRVAMIIGAIFISGYQIKENKERSEANQKDIHEMQLFNKDREKADEIMGNAILQINTNIQSMKDENKKQFECMTDKFDQQGKIMNEVKTDVAVTAEKVKTLTRDE